jgi:hypothetical protein
MDIRECNWKRANCKEAMTKWILLKHDLAEAKTFSPGFSD